MYRSWFWPLAVWYAGCWKRVSEMVRWLLIASQIGCSEMLEISYIEHLDAET
jgi:hypothetical protein